MSSTLPDPLATTAPLDPSSHSTRPPVLSPSLFVDAFNAEPCGLLLIDPATRTILAANHAFGALAGLDPAALAGQSIDAVPLLRDRPALADACVSVAPGKSIAITPSAATADERQIDCTVTGFAADGRARVRCSVVDVTVRSQCDRRARQTEKLESLRVLAGTVAHDFNNMLTCVRGYISVALETPSASAEVREILGHVNGATTRASELTQRLLGFSRKRKLQLAPLELGSFLNELAIRTRGSLPPGAQLAVTPHASPITIAADATQLRTVVESLLKNAREALRERGQITLSASIVHKPGPFARLTVQDDGAGMSPAVQSRLFEPGFTTKKTGGASGTSLAYAYSIVADHGGWIDVRSREGNGSTFSVLLPLAPPSAAW